MVRATDAKEWARETMVGLWTSPLVTFREHNYEIDFEGLRSNIDYMISGLRIEGIGFLHEPWTLTPSERKKCVEFYVAAVDGRIPAYVHAADHSAELTVEMVNHAASAGVDAVMLHPPYEWAKTDDMILAYYAYVASKTDIAILLLNSIHSGRIMSPELIAEIARLPAVCGLKNGVQTFEHTARTVELVGDEIVVSSPADEFAIDAISKLNQQIQLGITSIFLLQTPEFQPIRGYTTAAREGRVDVAQQIYFAISPMLELWNEMYELVWSDAHLHPVPMAKVWMVELGMVGGPMRPPADNVTESIRTSFKRRVRAAIESSQRNIAEADLSEFVQGRKRANL